jgi:hypothetical protein
VVVLLSLISSRVQATKVEVTAPDSSHMNGPVECPHQTIGDAMCAMLGGADLRPGFWPYSFHHFIHLYNVTLHRGSDKTPYEICLSKVNAAILTKSL